MKLHPAPVSKSVSFRFVSCDAGRMACLWDSGAWGLVLVCRVDDGDALG